MTLLLFEQSWMDVWDGAEPSEPVGAIFTKPEIIELILDLSGYVPTRERLANFRLLEPSCGDGAFVLAVIRRLLTSEHLHQSRIDWFDPALGHAITACDINTGFIRQSRQQVVSVLREEGCPSVRAEALADTWIIHADFLLHTWPNRFDWVVGNPPYVRIEDLPPRVLSRYRELYQTSSDRADLYVAFFENGLRLLSPRGRLAYICANRFAKNLYGRALRQFIAREYHVSHYLNLEHTQPFLSEVSAYPCVTILDRHRGQPTLATTLTDVEADTLATLSVQPSAHFSTFPSWYPDGAPWVATENAGFDHLTSLAERFPTLEDSAPGTCVGIGVATGADAVYVQSARLSSVEESCQLKLLMASDISPAKLTWSGHYLVNPFDEADDGSLRNLAAHPGLAGHFRHHETHLRARHIAQKRPVSWYRTIDRVHLSLVPRPKLVIPDIQKGGVVGFDTGGFYPHHNVYWITSEGWNLRALQALLRSTSVLKQIRAHSVQMRGGFIRYQAQVIRKIRLPKSSDLSSQLIERLAAVSASSDQAEIDRLSDLAFGISTATDQRKTSAGNV